jgi:DNA topoisomerase-1
MYATMLETDYMKKDQFNANFWKGFKGVLGSGHTIKSLDKCDFTPIHQHVVAERDAKKALPKEVHPEFYIS